MLSRVFCGLSHARQWGGGGCGTRAVLLVEERGFSKWGPTINSKMEKLKLTLLINIDFHFSPRNMRKHATIIQSKHWILQHESFLLFTVL